MAGEADAEDELLLEDQADEEQEDENEDDGAQEGDESDDDEQVISFGEEEPEESQQHGATSGLAKHLREEIKKRDARIRELERTGSQPKAEVGKKPDLWEDCEGDPDKFEAALEAYQKRKAEAEKQQEAAAEVAKKANEDWQSDLAGYHAKKAALPFADAQEAEDAAISVLSNVQQAAIVKAADNPAQLIYALGKYPAKLAELVKIDDPIKFAAAAARLEATMKVSTKKRVIEPDTPVRGNARLSGGDKREAELEKEADKTGDRSKLAAYRYEKRQKAKG